MLKDGFFRGKQKWQCGVRERARQAALYADPVFRARKLKDMKDHSSVKSRERYYARIDAGVCTRCMGPLLSDTLCWDCLNNLEERRVSASPVLRC